MRRLIALDAESRLTTEHVALAAAGLKVSQRTVWRWIETARLTKLPELPSDPYPT